MINDEVSFLKNIEILLLTYKHTYNHSLGEYLIVFGWKGSINF